MSSPRYAPLGALVLIALGLSACRAGGSTRAPFAVPGADVVAVDGVAGPVDPTAPRVLCVTAHPDDEIAFSGVVYKTSTHLGGVVDLCVITDGQGGFKYASLAEPVYGLELTDEKVGRRALPEIRRTELRAGCAWLGFRAIVHLDQVDHRYTQDVDEVLGEGADVWDLEFVRSSLDHLLEAGDYDVVLVMTPTAGTHAHHKAASLLAAEAVAKLPLPERPALLCVATESDAAEAAGTAAGPFEGLEGWPLSFVHEDLLFTFDRRQRFGFRERLDYSIVANWAIAEHRSQGTMQLLVDGADREVYSLLQVSPRARASYVAAWFERLREEQFPAKVYDATAGTNAVKGGSSR